MNYAEVEDYIFGRRRMGMKFGLQRVRKLMADAGDPEKSYRTIHVVGTNGKGSTTAFLAGILHEMGLRVGRMTSPHLLHYRERAAVDGQWMPEEAVVDFIERFRDRIEAYSATFFEITTVMSAWHFRNCGVDAVVAEAGLGGRLDATRLLNGELTVFTGVEIEHRRILGDTEALITAEKVAIARRGSTLIAYPQDPEVERVIQSAVQGSRLERILPEPADFAPLPGDHQKRNAGLAIAAAAEFTGTGTDVVTEIFRRSCDGFRWSGRIDLRRGDPPMLFDVAHNPGSMENLIEHLRTGWRLPLPAVVGFLEDKFWREMTEQLKGIFDPVVTTRPVNERSLSADVLADEFRKHGVEAVAETEIGRALERGRTLADRLLVITGSFFVTGEAMLTAWRKGWIALPETDEEPAQLFSSPGDVDSPEPTDL